MSDSSAFVHLHNHSDYSLLDGASKVDQLVETAVAMEMPALALTDHGNLFGAIQFYCAAQKKGLKPIIGCEIYVAKESRHKKTGGSDQANHLVLLAESAEGYHNLSRLVSYGYLEGFYYRPRVDRDLLSRYSKGLIALSACLKGGVQQKLLMEQHEAAVEEATSWRDIFGPGNFYLELQDHGLPAQQRRHAPPVPLRSRRRPWVRHEMMRCSRSGHIHRTCFSAVSRAAAPPGPPPAA